MRSEAPVPTVGQVVAVVDAQLGSGLLRCLGPGCGGRLARWGFGAERDLVGLGGVTGRVRPRRALCAVCGVSRVLLPDSMLRRRQYGVEVIWAALLAAARGRPWNQVAAQLGVPYTTVRDWLRRFTRRADRVHAWLCGLLPRLVDDPVWPAATPGAAGDVLAVLGALHQQMPGRWPLVAALTPGQLAARLSRCGLLAPPWPPGAVNTSSPVT
jgi:Homeodomain-like domain-containing protein